MAASRPAVALSLLCSLFLLCPFSSASAITLPSDSHKVSLTLYYESLCPYSANFIVNYLGKLFEDDLLSIVDLRLVPWGNAKLKGNDTFACQHGPGECLLNTIEACAIDAWPQLNDHFPFIYCVETLVYELKYLEWESCYGKLGLDSKPISDCYSNGLGLKKITTDKTGLFVCLEDIILIFRGLNYNMQLKLMPLNLLINMCLGLLWMDSHFMRTMKTI
ncbi:Thioredoxin superfamily protein isoform 2 [Theobroma cacao]|uniref:Thioredoxin superfamily protein isoform 2 n=1 Tax=Theobroma cacao TaxID=3641 RepID=A0A061H0D3_THECC|nr:Thioredoxin superfamily protein isoform 2 [Theobroma cacao]